MNYSAKYAVAALALASFFMVPSAALAICNGVGNTCGYSYSTASTYNRPYTYSPYYSSSYSYQPYYQQYSPYSYGYGYQQPLYFPVYSTYFPTYSYSSYSNYSSYGSYGSSYGYGYGGDCYYSNGYQICH